MSVIQSRTVVNNCIYLYTRSRFLSKASQNDLKRCHLLTRGSFHHHGHRTFFSKSNSSSASAEPAPAELVVKPAEPQELAEIEVPSLDTLPTTRRATTTPNFFRHFSDKDIREVDDETRARIHQVSSEIASAQSSSLVDPAHVWRRKEIFIMEEEEWVDTYVLKERPPLIDRIAGGESFFLRREGPEIRNHTDNLATIQADIDMRPRNMKRLMKKWSWDGGVIDQTYNEKRNRILGNELAAAHFIVSRKGKVKFLGHDQWVTDYRKDAKPGVEEEDLPVISEELCVLPTHYDPKNRIEAIDASKVELHYEGLLNLEKLNHVKAIRLRESPFLDDWGVERIARMFGETLQYIDLSGCRRVTDRGIGVLHRCRELKAIVVEDMPHLDDLEIVCAMLEDLNPNLQVIGIDYEKKMEKMKLEAEKLERMALYEQDLEQLEPISLSYLNEKTLPLKEYSDTMSLKDDKKLLLQLDSPSPKVEVKVKQWYD